MAEIRDRHSMDYLYSAQLVFNREISEVAFQRNVTRLIFQNQQFLNLTEPLFSQPTVEN